MALPLLLAVISEDIADDRSEIAYYTRQIAELKNDLACAESRLAIYQEELNHRIAHREMILAEMAS